MGILGLLEFLNVSFDYLLLRMAADTDASLSLFCAHTFAAPKYAELSGAAMLCRGKVL